MAKRKRKNKLHAVKTATGDSKKESRRLAELKELEAQGKITDLQTQVKYLLIPSQYETQIVKGKPKRVCVERSCSYIADFVYHDAEDNLVVEDVKGYKKGCTYALFTVKRKLMLQLYGIKIKET